MITVDIDRVAQLGRIMDQARVAVEHHDLATAWPLLIQAVGGVMVSDDEAWEWPESVHLHELVKRKIPLRLIGGDGGGDELRQQMVEALAALRRRIDEVLADHRTTNGMELNFGYPGSD